MRRRMCPRAGPHRLRADVARDAGVHRRARARHADEIWLTEHPPVYTLGLAGRREHLLRDNGIPVDQGRSRRAGHVSRARAARRVYAGRPAARAARRSATMVRAHRERGDRMAWRAWASRRTASRRRPACTSMRAGRRGQDRRARAQGAQRLHVSRPRGEHRDGSRALRATSIRAAIRPRGHAARRSRRRDARSSAAGARAGADARDSHVAMQTDRCDRAASTHRRPQRRRRQAQGRRQDARASPSRSSRRRR